jgi:hypothetical protein
MDVGHLNLKLFPKGDEARNRSHWGTPFISFRLHLHSNMLDA